MQEVDIIFTAHYQHLKNPNFPQVFNTFFVTIHGIAVSVWMTFSKKGKCNFYSTCLFKAQTGDQRKIFKNDKNQQMVKRIFKKERFETTVNPQALK